MKTREQCRCGKDRGEYYARESCREADCVKRRARMKRLRDRRVAAGIHPKKPYTCWLEAADKARTRVSGYSQQERNNLELRGRKIISSALDMWCVEMKARLDAMTDEELITKLKAVGCKFKDD